MSKKTNPLGFDGLRGLPRLWKRGSTPINKSGLNDLERHLPQIDSPILLGAAAVGALGAGLALSRLRSGGRGGRSKRFEQWVCQALKRADGTIPEGDEVVRRIQVEVLEGFGKMPLVDIEILVDDQALVWTHLMGEDLLELVAKTAWNNPEIAPVAVRARLLSAIDGHEVADMSTLGFDAEAARPSDLFERFGAPASDPFWKG